MNAFEKVFGGVNVSFLRSSTERPIRQGKTARDKAKGHIPYTKNRRIWDNSDKKWVKA
ncbi:MAG: hypothetical protein ACRC91_04730 [Aeromonas sp.]